MPASAASLRSIRYKHPRGLSFPRLIELALSRLSELLDKPGCAQWRAIFSDAPVRGKTRERRKRIDGATNVAALLSAMIASADIERGLVARPVNDTWERKTWYALDTLSYGERVPGARSMRRTERAAAELSAQGFIRSIPWRVITSDGIRAAPGLKFITEKLWRALGLWDAARAERRQRKQRAADAKKVALDEALGGVVQRIPTQAPVHRSAARSQAGNAPQSPVPTRPPPQGASPTGRAHIGAINKALGLK